MNHDELRRSSTSERLRSGSLSSNNSRLGTLETKRFDPKKDGYRTLFLAARKLHGRRDNGGISWNDIRSLYRKETNRHLNSEELNLICGTQKKTKYELLHEKLAHIFDPMDDKAHFIRLRSLTSPLPLAMHQDRAGPSSRPISPLSVEAPDGRRLSVEEKRKAITENLLRCGLLMSDGSMSNSNKSIFSHSSSVSTDQPTNDVSLPMEEDVFDDQPPIVEEPRNNVEGDQEESADDAEDEEAAYNSWAAHTRTFSQEENSEEATEKFERSVLERRNSVGSIDGEEETDHPSVLQISADDEETDAAKAQVSSLSSTMNVAFIASESQYISFDSVTGGTETSGEQGYTTGNDQLSPSPLSDPDISLHFSSSPVNGREPDTPRITHEITMCSSRNENDDSVAMPQPDVSPLTEDDGEDNDVSEVRYRPVDRSQADNGDSLEDRVPHLSLPRGSHLRDLSRGDYGTNDTSGQSVTSHDDVAAAFEEKPYQTFPAVSDTVFEASTDDSNLGTTSATVVLKNEPPVIPPLFTKASGDHADTDDDNISYDDESQKSDDEHHHHNQEAKAVVLPAGDTAVSTATVELEINDEVQDESASGTVASEENPVVVKMVGDFLRKPSDNLERQTSSLSTIPEDRETISSVSPMKEPEDAEVGDNNIVPAEAAPEAPEQKKKERRVRIRMPRRRWFDCCTIL